MSISNESPWLNEIPSTEKIVGHYEFPTGAINYMMYVDEGINDNFHYIVPSPSTPSNAYTAELVRSGNTFYAKINGSTIKTYTCSSTSCGYAKIFGAVSWGAKSSSDFNVYGYIWNLQFMRPNDTQYQDYVSGVGTLIKCYEQPSDLGFKSPRTQPYNQIIVDATTKHDCVGYNSTLTYSLSYLSVNNILSLNKEKLFTLLIPSYPLPHTQLKVCLQF